MAWHTAASWSPTSTMSPKSRTASPAPTTATIPPFTIISSQALPLGPHEFSYATLLHVLATKPDTVVPPGKSIRAALLRPDSTSASSSTEASATTSENSPQNLQSTVEKIVHRAFWDEALESLSDPVPSRQLARLRLLYKDLHEAFEGLLPKNHPSYVTLVDPISPTPAPLLSARRHLTEVVAAIQRRCAPVRDPQIDIVRSYLSNEEVSDLPERITQAAKSLLEIADMMRKDLANAILSSVSDDELEKEVVRAAMVEERRAVLEVYGARGVRERWNTWLRDGDADEVGFTWVRRLVKALGADVVISFPPPSPDVSISGTSNDECRNQINAIPPPFLFSATDLFHIQNHIQALVISAILRTLVPLRPSPTPHPSTNSNVKTNHATKEDVHYDEIAKGRTFVERVLELLMIEVDESSLDAGTTKLVNLADEVAREHRRLSDYAASISSEETRPSPIDERTLRDRVDTLLKPTNPVFILLRKRLLTTLSEWIISALQTQANERERRRVPENMHSGRELKRPRLDFPIAPSPGPSSSPSSSTKEEKGALRRIVEEKTQTGRVQAKGFEDPVLQRGIRDLLSELADVVEWVKDTWTGMSLDLDGLDNFETEVDGEQDESERKGVEKGDGEDNDET